jgi:putative transposase
MKIFHGEGLRKGRLSLAGQPYLVTTVTHDRKPLLSDLQTGRVVVNALRYQSECGAAETVAFVVMPDHLHWLFTLTGKVELSDLIRSVKGFSSKGIHVLLGRNADPMSALSPTHDPVWQKGFYDHALRSDEDVRSAARYLVMNPVRAGIVSSVWDFSLWDAVWI